MTPRAYEDERTLVQIGEREGIPIHKLRYVVASRGIRPDRRVGVTRLFKPETVAQILEAVEGVQPRCYAD